MDEDEKQKALVTGWFSFADGHATAGDLLARDLVCRWLTDNNYPYDVATVPHFGEGVDWRSVDPALYSHVVFVCGPFEKKPYETEFLKRFENSRLIGLNLSMIESLEYWSPFDLLIERDSSERAAPDMVFATVQKPVPVMGICLVEAYDGARVSDANKAVQRLADSSEMARVNIDTRLDSNSTGLRSPSEIETIIARMDLVVTTRLHGMVLALKNGVPPIAIDPVPGGHKIMRQAELIGWPVVFAVGEVTDSALREAYDFCLTEEARKKAEECHARALEGVREVHEKFIAALTGSDIIESNYQKRTSASLRHVSCSERNKPVSFGDLRNVEPVSRDFGFERGRPIDRHYIEAFLNTHAPSIHGAVLEIGDDTYTRKYGGQDVDSSDVFNLIADSPGTTYSGDLTDAAHIPSDRFDCVIITQTLHLIFDFRSAVRTLHRILKPGGTVLATFPGISQISDDQWREQWYWGFTALSAHKMFEDVFPKDLIEVRSYGNVLASTAFLEGIAVHELEQHELDHYDPEYEMLIAVKAVKQVPVNDE